MSSSLINRTNKKIQREDFSPRFCVIGRSVYLERNFFRLDSRQFPQKLKSGGFVDILVVFAEKNIKIRIFGIATIEEEEKKIACYKLFNELSAQYNFFRIYIHPNGDISLEGDVVLGVVEGEFQPKALMGFVIAAINLLEKSYKDIMKIQWA
ncbi:MAG: hypothetical protein IJG24_05655 [Selenomonadaceae bacterium]|nr:hypothetical protein [Selenomonadaceae bacterium]